MRVEGYLREDTARYRLLRYLRNWKRRLFVNLFRNKRRRFWKYTELARYLLERLLFVGPMQGGVVEPVHDGWFDDFEIGRDVEIARHIERGVADVQDFAAGLSRSWLRGPRPERVGHRVAR